MNRPSLESITISTVLNEEYILWIEMSQEYFIIYLSEKDNAKERMIVADESGILAMTKISIPDFLEIVAIHKDLEKQLSQGLLLENAIKEYIEEP